MATTLSLVLAQYNFTVGDIAGNTHIILNASKQAAKQGHDVIVFPELALTGYPPEDLLMRQDLATQVEQAIARLCLAALPLTLIIGAPHYEHENCYNAAFVIAHGQLTAIYHKQCLPNYGVFDEKRYFSSGTETTLITVNGVSVGLLICEDLWVEAPTHQLAKAGCELIICLNASPYDHTKSEVRKEIACEKARQYQLPIAYCHGTGGQDELIFDGGSFVMDIKGIVIHQAPYFEAVALPVTLSFPYQPQTPDPTTELPECEHIYQALVLAVRDYVYKNGFNGVLLGLSGGIDSALCLAIAVDALGHDAVSAYMLPSRHTSTLSLEEAANMASQLGVHYQEISIEPAYQAFLASLHDALANTAPDTTEENIQARCRGVILMALSNKFGRLLLTTGNKSEMAVGYATLYGDMAGGFAVLKDVPKTWVFRLAEYRNERSMVIPQRIIDRPPTAELATNQFDESSLPPYPELDDILMRYVEHDESIATIIAAGHSPETVRHIVKLVNRAEYKRRQAAPGPKITQRAFGRERRYPITSKFKD